MRNTSLPDFLMIGAGKCGTTSLWRYLDQSPAIVMSAVKEPGFFSHDQVYARGVEWYSSLFNRPKTDILVGEATNAYSALDSYPKTLTRMQATLPEHTGFIFCTRNPIRRTESEYMHLVNSGMKMSFSEFLSENRAFRDKNKYLRTFQRYACAFGESRVHSMVFEDLVADPEHQVEKCCNFLGVKPPSNFEGIVYGASSKQTRLPRVLRRIRSSGKYAQIAHMVPQQFKDVVSQIFGKPVLNSRPRWKGEDFQNFVKEHEALSKDYLRLIGKSEDFWSFDPSIVDLR